MSRIRLEPLKLPKKGRITPDSEDYNDRSKVHNNRGDKWDLTKTYSGAGNPSRMSKKQNDPVSIAGNKSSVVPLNEDQIKFFDFNLHSIKKAVSSALLDVALLMANASQLKSVYLMGKKHPFYTAMMALLITSITAQILVGVLLVVLMRININEANEKKQKLAENLNTVCVVGIFLVTLVNIFIAAIGISSNDVDLYQIALDAHKGQ